MKFTKKRPTKVGTQFAAIWEFGNKVWADTYYNSEKGLLRYNERNDKGGKTGTWLGGYSPTGYEPWHQYPHKFAIMKENK